MKSNTCFKSIIAFPNTLSVMNVFQKEFCWQRAVNRQPGFRSGNSKGRSLSRYHFPGNSEISKKKLLNFQFL